jgi:hypothetical protein
MAGPPGWDWNQSPDGPGVKAQVQVGPETGRRPERVGLRVDLATANERATGRNPVCEPGGSRMERDRYIHQGTIRGGQIIRRVCVLHCEARGQIRVGPDHGPEPRGRCLRLGEGRAEWILARSLSARRWEADR